jgi:hypothetical protein
MESAGRATELDTSTSEGALAMFFGRRRLYYRDSYGRWREDHRAGHRPGIPAKWAVIVLVVLAGLMVLASLLQSVGHAVMHG